LAALRAIKFENPKVQNYDTKLFCNVTTSVKISIMALVEGT